MKDLLLFSALCTLCALVFIFSSAVTVAIGFLTIGTITFNEFVNLLVSWYAFKFFATLYCSVQDDISKNCNNFDEKNDVQTAKNQND